MDKNRPIMGCSTWSFGLVYKFAGRLFLPSNVDVACTCSFHPILVSIRCCRIQDFVSKEELLMSGFCWLPTRKHWTLRVPHANA